jgi:hypothetical protein
VGDEALVLERHKRVESLEEGQSAGEEEGKVGKVWLERLLTSVRDR